MTSAELSMLYAQQQYALTCTLRGSFPRASAEQIEDAIGEAWVQAARHRRQLRPDSAGWLYVVARHELLRCLGRPRTSALRADDACAASDASHHDLRDAFEALAQCKPDEIRAIYGQAIGLSRPELQRALGWSSRKVDRCLYEGRARVRSLAA